MEDNDCFKTELSAFLCIISLPYFTLCYKICVENTFALEKRMIFAVFLVMQAFIRNSTGEAVVHNLGY